MHWNTTSLTFVKTQLSGCNRKSTESGCKAVAPTSVLLDPDSMVSEYVLCMSTSVLRNKALVLLILYTGSVTRMHPAFLETPHPCSKRMSPTTSSLARTSLIGSIYYSDKNTSSYISTGRLSTTTTLLADTVKLKLWKHIMLIYIFINISSTNL